MAYDIAISNVAVLIYRRYLCYMKCQLDSHHNNSVPTHNTSSYRYYLNVVHLVGCNFYNFIYLNDCILFSL